MCARNAGEGQKTLLGGSIWPFVFTQSQRYVPSVDYANIEEAARRFALLGDPTRLRVLKALMEGGELSVHAVAGAAGVSRFNASAHLNRLALGKLATRRREGTSILYRADDRFVPRLCEIMCDSLEAPPRQAAG